MILNIGFKSDGMVPTSEFRDMPELKVGDVVDVYVENQEDKAGQLILSRKLAKVMTAWKNIEDALEQDIVIDGFVKRRTKGGLIVLLFTAIILNTYRCTNLNTFTNILNSAYYSI